VRAKKILLLSSSLAYGGADVVVRQLAMALRTAGSAVAVVSMVEPKAFTSELESAGVQVVSLDMRRGALNARGVARFFRYLRQFRPDLIHAHMYHASILARLARVVVRIPVICTVHNEFEWSHRGTSGRFRDWVYRSTDAAANITTAVSERVHQRYVNDRIVLPHRILVIENGIDCERFPRSDEERTATRRALDWHDSFIWLAVGRLEIAKDYPNLIHAFREVHRRLPLSKLAIVGEGSVRNEIEELIEISGLRDAIVLHGLRRDVPDLLNACDALVMSSAWEGAPLVLLEACAAERPVVSTEVGSAAEIIIPGQTGLLVPPRDANALAHGMFELMAFGKETLDKMGQHARRHIQERFSLRTVHDKYMSLYENVLVASR